MTQSIKISNFGFGIVPFGRQSSGRIERLFYFSSYPYRTWNTQRRLSDDSHCIFWDNACMRKIQPDENMMRRTLRKALQGVAKGQTPFGACIVREGGVVALAHNTVLKSGDPTAHAEVNAIRKAARRLQTIDLSGCVLYSTCEPCPMCFAAIHWARLDAVIFGARIADARSLGFNELAVPDRTLKRLGRSPVMLVEDFLRDECMALFLTWKAGPARVY